MTDNHIDNLIELADRIEYFKSHKDDYKKDNSDDFDWRPQRLDEYEVPVFHIPYSRKEKSTREMLAKVLAFIYLNKHRRYADCCTIMPIATTSKRLISIWGSQREVSRAISYMIELGLIAVESEEYQYNANCKQYNKSKTYRYFVENERLIEVYCIDNDINKYRVQNRKHRKSGNNIYDTVVDTFVPEQVRFSSKVHFLKKDNWSVAQHEDYLYEQLYINYPQLEHYQELADEMNATYYDEYPEFQYQFIPTFTWTNNKYVRKIGIRATNSLVSASTKAKEEASPDFHGQFKADILEKYGFNLEYDVASSVPRITTSINAGYWISESIDMYKVIFDIFIRKLYPNMCEKYYKDIVDLKFNDYRKAFKSFHMSGYFDSESQIDNHLSNKAHYNKKNHQKERDEVEYLMHIYQDAVIEAEGGYTFDSEIFLHESCIYMDVTKRLLDEGFFVWNCYDAWYAVNEVISQEEYLEYCEKIVEECFNQYVDTYQICKKVSSEIHNHIFY